MTTNNEVKIPIKDFAHISLILIATAMNYIKIAVNEALELP